MNPRLGAYGHEARLRGLEIADARECASWTETRGMPCAATHGRGGVRDAVVLLSGMLGQLGAGWRRWRACIVAFVLAVTILCGQPALAYGAGNGANRPSAPPAATVAQGKPNQANPTAGTKSVLHKPPTAKGLPPFTPLSKEPAMSHGFVASMKPANVTLSTTADTRFVGSDGRLEIDVPAGAITAADVSAAGGRVVLKVTEIAPPAGSNAGGSGIVSFGSYLVQIEDAHGNPLAHGLRVAVTLKLHYGKLHGLDMSRAFVTFNGSHPKLVSNLGPYSTQKATNDAQHQVLQAQLPADPKVAASATAPHADAGRAAAMLGPAEAAAPNQYTLPSTSFTWSTIAPVATVGAPDPFNVDLNAGSLTEGTQIDVPAGPAGAMPNITLAYNSAAVNESHSPQGAAGWAGEGWSMTLGSISWSEHNVTSSCLSTCGSNWEDSWTLNDPFGTSTDLIPPNNATSTYSDDTTNWYCAVSSSGTPCPIQFHTARETYAKVYAYVGPLTLDGNPDHPPCFRVYLTNGVMEEFGCTPDSIEYYPIQKNSQPGQVNNDLYYPVNWMLDLITNPQGDQVHITYQADSETAPDNLPYTRDLVMKTIEWDSKACSNAQTMCTGTAWQPLYRVYFSATHQQSGILRTTTTGSCNPNSSVRCDDPASVSGGISAPLVNGTFALNDIDVQINTSSENGGTYSGSTWNTLRDYQLSYEQSGPTTITDPVTNMQEQTAGYLDLTQVKEVGDDGALAYPATTYSYTSQTEYYEDGAYSPATASLCGPSWNTGGNGGSCDLWSQSYDGNSRYIATAYNGQGLQQAFSWANARNNTHGVNSGGSPSDPLYCDSHQSGYPCNSADDEAWSRIVLTGRTDTVTQLTQAGQGGTQTTTPINSSYAFTYTQTYPLAAQECGDCVAGMYWGNQNNGDYLDYYNSTFMGFSSASVSNPDGSVETHQYYTTQGWGIYDTSKGLTCPSTLPPISTTCHAAPWWNVMNAGHGLETGATSYATDGVTVLKQASDSYNAVCPPSGVAATPQYVASNGTFGPWDGQLVAMLNHNNPIADCDVQLTQTTTTMWDGQTSNGVTDTEAYSYDSSGRVTKVTRTSNSGGASPKQIVQDTGYQTINSLAIPAEQDANDTPQTSGWSGVYILDLVNSTDTQDGSGNKTTCSAANYGTSGNTAGAETESDSYTACGGAANKTTMAYDNLGNQTSTTDADGNGGVGGHTGASGTACAGATTCSSYGDQTQAVTTRTANAANQSNSTAQTYTAADGFGQWPASTTDANGITTAYVYDALGRATQVQEDGQTSPPTRQTSYYTLCLGASGQPPCYSEVDTAQRISSSDTVLTRQFYDGAGRLVETRSAAPGGQDTVQYTLYNVMGQASQQSGSYFVAGYEGVGGVAAAFSIPDTTQPVMAATYDGLGRMLSVQDQLGETSTESYSIVCNAPGTNDTGCYEQTLAVDANHHQAGTLADGFGRQIYAQQYSGNNNPAPYALYSTVATKYDTSGRVVQQTHANGSQTTDTYNGDGTLASSNDPDQGTMSYGYDANGNQTQQVDARGAAGTTYTGYDGLNRPVWRNTSNSASGAYVTYSYDAGMAGSFGIGRLTAEVFRGGSGTVATPFSGAYTYSYDALGRTIRTDQTMGGAGACPSGWSCQDIGSPTLAGGQNAAGDGIWTIQGSGSDIYGTSDQFHFISESLTGDGSISAHVDSTTYTNVYAKTGVMLRSTNAANSANYHLHLDAGGNYFVSYRSTAGGGTTNLTSGTLSAPAWIQVSRSGSTYSAYSSADGVHWTLVPNSIITLSLGSTVLAGVDVTSHNTGAVATGTVDSVAVTTGGMGACPSGWSCQDIGSPTPAGTQNALGNGEWNVIGGGADIWGTSDQFHYVSQSQAGDGSLVVRVEAQTNTSSWAKVGVMFRATSAANAPYYYLQVLPNNSSTFQVNERTSAGASAQTVSSGSVTVPMWLKVTRSGGTNFSASTSSDGTHWTLLSGSSVTLSNLGGAILAGVAVTSHNTSATSTATVDQLSPSFTPPGSVTVTPLASPTGVTSYVTQQSYDDAGAPTMAVYPDGETVTTSYTGQDWLAGLSTTQGGTTTTLLSNVSYSGAGGAAQEMTGASLANGVYNEALTYDAMARPTETSLTRASDGTLLFDSKRAYDAVGNVADVWTTLPTGTDYQAFCYDEQNRLTWGGSASGIIPCGDGRMWTAGSLASAAYSNTYTYDTLNRLASGPGGNYTYGDTHHLDAATAILKGGSGYTATYDAAGNMTCRAPTSSTTCAGTQTGQQLTYDNEGRLSTWQNQPTTPTSSTSNLYDGEGNRVAQSVTNGAATTTITYVGSVEELSSTVGVTTTTTTYSAEGKRIAQAVNGAFSYLGSDGLGSAEVALDGGGTAQASVLYDPYGNVRYSSGSMPGSYGYTGQRADAATGLDYYGARYYDAVAGQFTSADSLAAGGLNRYAYVAGNPETATDPTGHRYCTSDGSTCSGRAGGGTGSSSGGCTSNCGGSPCGGCKTAPGGSSGGSTCARNCEPGCKGTVAQCQMWGGLQSGDEQHWELLIGVAQFAIGVVRLIFDVWDLLHRGSLDGFEKLTKFVELLADGLTVISGGLNIAQALGWGNFAGLRQWVSRAGAVLNYVAAGLRAIGRNAGWFISLTIGLLWNGATRLNFAGILLGIGQMILSNLGVADNLKAFLSRIGQGILDQFDANLASDQAKDINQWCASSGSCPGYK